MALTQTTTSTAVLVTDQFVNVTSATGFAAGQFLRIDNEWMLISRDYVSGTAIPVVRRGDQGSRQVPHNALANAVTGLASDVADLGTYAEDPIPYWRPNVQVYSVSGAIDVPKRDTQVYISKAGVAVMTLAAPGKDQDGIRMSIFSTTAQVHTITATSLFADGTSGSPHTTATFTTGFIGQGLVLLAFQGIWYVESQAHVAFT